MNTFQSPQYGPIGLVTKKAVHIQQQPMRRQYVPVQQLTKKVALLKVYAGMEASIVSAVMASGYDGLVLEGFGQGNVPPEVAEVVTELVQNGIPVVLVSRCFNGITEGVYSYEGGGKQLEDAGVIFANGINGQKARLKLLIGLNQKDTPIDLKLFFA